MILLLGLSMGTAAHAQTSSVRFRSEANPTKNFSQASFLGSGFYVVDDRQVFIVRIDMKFPIRRMDERRTGIHFTLRPTLGFFNFKPSDALDFDLPDEVGTFGLLPGVEFRVPVTRHWRLEPFVEVGPTLETETDKVTWIYGAGVRSRAEFPGEKAKFLLWNTLLWAGNWESDVAPHDDFVVLETAGEWRRQVPWTLFGTRTDLGPLLRAEIYWDVLRIDPPQGEGIEIEHRYEAGVTWGPRQRTVKKRITIPRFSMSYRFGDGANGYRVGASTRF
ncbi:MAG: hypothetical protein O7A07_07975 [Acidobacteria bacterium]|nr:hypothetical protein [Acidobacteriota bacterium]